MERTAVKEKPINSHAKNYKSWKLAVESSVYNFGKRTFDIGVGMVGTMLLLPVMAGVKLANLKNGDTAPILFRQERIGKDGNPIHIYKIRSMVPNAEQVLENLMNEDPAIKKEYEKNKKLENDPRVTKVGAFIRKTSLDEFGQFVNVLKGEMSIVGPRPYLPREQKDMGRYYQDVIKCKPGITGLWQVEGRSDIGFKNRCRLDKFYNDHKGMGFDTKIFLKTFTSVLKSRGAK